MLATRPTRRRQPADEEIDPTPRPVRVLKYDEDLKYLERWFFYVAGRLTETPEERIERYLSDDRLGNLAALAAISGRKYSYIKRLNSDSNAWRRQLRDLSPIDEDAYNELAATMLAAENAGDLARVDQLAAELRDLDAKRDASKHIAHIRELRELMVDAVPESVAPGMAPVWPIKALFAYARKMKWLDGWYEPVKKDPPGRRRGSKNRPRTA